MPHGAMAVLFGVSLLYAVLALIMGARNFWRDMGEPIATLSNPRSLWQAIQDALSLRYLDGGGDGCYATELKPDDRRRLFHHFTFGGFGLCFAATTVATLYHYVCGREAPYPWWDLPVLLGAVELSYLIAQHLPPV
jgi:citrate/tricarballylate utilization protein